MISCLEFYNEENVTVLESYNNDLIRIREIFNDTKNSSNKYDIYFNHTSQFIIFLDELQEILSDNHFKMKSFEELREENTNIYCEIFEENYKKSYANPSFAVSVLGDEVGKLFSAFYAKCREGISSAYKHRIFDLQENNSSFIKLYDAVKKNVMDYEKLKEILFSLNRESILRNLRYRFEERMNVNYGFYLDTILNSDLSDLRYLFRFDKYITGNEIKTAEFLAKYPKEKIDKLCKTLVEAFKRGFVVDNKDRKERNNVRLMYRAGQEIIIKQLIKEFKNNGFTATIAFLESTEANKQYNYDHKFDNALYVDEAYAKIKEECHKEAYELCIESVKYQAGPLLFEGFGEKPFTPEKKKECLKLSKIQEDLIKDITNKIDEVDNKYQPNENTSFCIVAFPIPEIGEKFEDIFEDVFKINMMDNDLYEGIQQSIIDGLDKGEYVHIKGKGDNETDIKVKLPKLKNTEKETNFYNCVADVNIPLGEVFTSPSLTGTNGVLHIKDIYLDLRYQNLKLTFKDGYVVDYSCTNFDNEEDNKEYIKENLMELHDKLPLGEFAIGTNTTAYVMARKYNIIEILPILIIEKMGPHFAIGDTCYTWVEDLPVYNVLNKKEIIARDNEKSILRKKDISKAYTGVHTDITLPYEEIEFISVVTKNEDHIDIIRDGRFVLEGTQELNKAFED